MTTAQARKAQGVNWIYFPSSRRPPQLAQDVITAFDKVGATISSRTNTLSSNEVLRVVAPGLIAHGFVVESGKKASEKVTVPVLFGRNGQLRKHFCADAYHSGEGFVVEIEAGRALSNNQFLKDLFEACMMAEVRTLCIAVRNIYSRQKDFEYIATFFDTLYASNRLALPLEGILLIGY